MTILDLQPSPLLKQQFNLRYAKKIPKISGCYILTTFNNEILYIGLATNLNSRIKQHLENSEKTSPTHNGKAIWFYYLECKGVELNKLERTWLNQYTNFHGVRPILNKIDSPI